MMLFARGPVLRGADPATVMLLVKAVLADFLVRKCATDMYDPKNLCCSPELEMLARHFFPISSDNVYSSRVRGGFDDTEALLSRRA